MGLILASFSGPGTASFFKEKPFPDEHFRAPHKALASWRWSNFTESRAPPLRRVTYINMDETSVKMWNPNGPGFVVLSSNGRRAHALERETYAPLRERRSALSLIAFISDDASVQACLPQLLVLNNKLLTHGDLERVRRYAERNNHVRVVHRTTAWVDADMMCEILAILKTCLRPVEPYVSLVSSVIARRHTHRYGSCAMPRR